MTDAMKKTLCCLVAAVLFLLLLPMSGCDGAGKPEGSTAPGGEITLHWWAFPTFAQENPGDAPGTYEEKLIRAFETVNPGIKVELTVLDFTTGPEKLAHALATKNDCDVLFDAPGRIIAYGKAGYLAKLNDLFDEAFVADVSNDTLLQACKDGDTAYMYPISSAPFYMAFNRAMLEDAGVLDLVREGWTTEDFTAVLEALHEKEYVPGSVFCKDQGGDQGTRSFVANLFDSAVTNGTATQYTLNDAGGTKAVRYIKECVDKGLLVNGTYWNGTDAILNFVNGRASFSLLWGPNQQNSYAGVLADNGISVVEVPFPSEDGAATLEYLVNGFCVMNNDNAEKTEAAKAFIRFLCDDEKWGPENVVRTGCIPVRTSFGCLYTEARMEEIMRWTSDYAPYYNTVDGFSAMRNEWSAMLKKIMNGYLPPEQALSVFAERANASLGKK